MKNRLLILLSGLCVIITNMPSYSMSSKTLRQLCVNTCVKEINHYIKRPETPYYHVNIATLLPEEVSKMITGALINKWANKTFSNRQDNRLCFDGRNLARAEHLNPTNKINTDGSNSPWSTLPLIELVHRINTIRYAWKNKLPYPGEIITPVHQTTHRSLTPEYVSRNMTELDLDATI
jgi:hypothetical protein